MEGVLSLISVGTLRPIKNHVFQIYVLKEIIEMELTGQLYSLVMVLNEES